MSYGFRAVVQSDEQLFRIWLAAPHVREWWDDGPEITEEWLADERVARWIVDYHGKPFAYMQDYDPHGWDDHPFAYLPKGARGIDQYIGEARMLGIGHGTGFIAQRVAALFSAGAPVVCVDPHPENARAIAVYQKVGFKVKGPTRDTQWGRILPMELWP